MKRFDVSWWGKAGTFLPDVRLPVLPARLGRRLPAAHSCSGSLGWLLGLPGLVLSYYAAITYIPTMRDASPSAAPARDGADGIR